MHWHETAAHSGGFFVGVAEVVEGYPHVAQHRCRAVDSPPRLRAKWVGFVAVMQMVAGRAVAGASHGFTTEFFDAEWCVLTMVGRGVSLWAPLGPLMVSELIKGDQTSCR
ncbi:hypothetical protein BTW07_14830 [Salinicola socius]|uniref:Uncharacterized protein n=1 Tax=Salinicola socius TaxID=404433 RepID=A0A1Q8SPJ9_9GAMM|nr:hypothetical protein BTW07_14830 [Salinicola socius]